jgi:hypothetical protein
MDGGKDAAVKRLMTNVNIRPREKINMDVDFLPTH